MKTACLLCPIHIFKLNFLILWKVFLTKKKFLNFIKNILSIFTVKCKWWLENHQFSLFFKFAWPSINFWISRLSNLSTITRFAISQQLSGSLDLYCKLFRCSYQHTGHFHYHSRLTVYKKIIENLLILSGRRNKFASDKRRLSGISKKCMHCSQNAL